MKGFVYGCVERENGILHDEDFVDRHAYVLTPEKGRYFMKTPLQ